MPPNDPAPYGTPPSGQAHGTPAPDGFVAAPVIAPPAAPKVRERRAGTGVVVGLILLSGAVLLAQDRLGIGTPGPADEISFWTAWIGVSTVIVGLALVVAGLRGRTGGGLNFWAVVAVVIALTGWVAWVDEGYDGPTIVENTLRIDGDAMSVNAGTVAVTDPDQAENGIEVPWGNPVVDLTGLDLTDATADDPVRVPVSMLSGDAQIIVPDGVAVEADVELAAGVAHWRVDGEDVSLTNFGNNTLFSNEEADSDGAVLHLDVEVASGTIEITED